MKKISKYFLMPLFAAALITACSSEDALEPSGANDNFFSVPADATDAESVLRRNFYNETGIHLLYNDTLRKEYQGTDEYGKKLWKVETVDLGYNLTSTSSSAFTPYYIYNQEDKQAVADLIRRYILPHIAGGKLMPYSILALDRIESTDRYGDPTEPLTMSCMRCLAIAAKGWLEAEGEEQAEYTQTVLKELVNTRYNTESDEATPFLDISYEYSGEYLADIYDDWDNEDPDETLAYELGYLRIRYSSWYEEYYIPYTNDDFKDFFNLVMDSTYEEVEEQWGEYPAIMKKYNIMRNAIMEMGYKF